MELLWKHLVQITYLRLGRGEKMTKTVKIICGCLICFGFGFLVAGVSISRLSMTGPEFLGIALGIIALILGIIPLVQSPGLQTSLDKLSTQVDGLCRDFATLSGEEGMFYKVLEHLPLAGGKTIVPPGEIFTGNPSPSTPRVKRSKP